MAAIRGTNTRPELVIRKALHGRGFRYRIHAKDIPGKPDLALPKYRAVILVHGCFWHGHGCSIFKWPKTRQEFWRDKIGGNCARDALVRERLHDAGWRVATIWECALKGKNRRPIPEIVDSLAGWLSSDESELFIEERCVD